MLELQRIVAERGWSKPYWERWFRGVFGGGGGGGGAGGGGGGGGLLGGGGGERKAAGEDPVGHLYPEYLNIYADRGNIAVLTRRAALRGHELAVAAISVEDESTQARTTCSTSAAGRTASRR